MEKIICCSTNKLYSHGTYIRSSDLQVIKRFKCPTCKRTFSRLASPMELPGKRINMTQKINSLLKKGLSTREIATMLHITTTMVSRKRTLFKKMMDQQTTPGAAN